MKKSFISVVFILVLILSNCLNNIKAQNFNILSINSTTKEIECTRLVKVDSTLNANQLYNIIKEWFSTDIGKFQRRGSEKGSATNDAIWGTQKKDMENVDLFYKNETPLTYEDPQHKKLIGRAVCKYFGSSYGCIRLVYLTFDIEVQMKDGRYKCQANNFRYEHFNPYTGKRMTVNAWKDEGPCKSNGRLDDLIYCNKCQDALKKMYYYLDTQVLLLINDLNEFVTSYNAKSDDW